MARTIPPDRFPAVIAASARVFISHGYQRAQVQDVADVLGLAKGTLYGYAQGKAALLAAAVRYADGHEPLPALEDLPVPAPADGEIAALVAGRLAGEVVDMKLAHALTDPLPVEATPSQRCAELAGIVTDLYARLARHRIAIKLVDSCAAELPDLAEVWFRTGRHAQVSGVEEYLLRRQRAGTVSLPGPAARAGAVGRPDDRGAVRAVGGALPLRPSTRPVLDRPTRPDRRPGGRRDAR
jgi:AcrR family transcriptional regulator